MAKEYKFSFVIEGDDAKATKALRKVKEEIDKVDDSQKKITKTTKEHSEWVEKARKNLSQYALIAGGAAVAATAYFVKSTINAQDELAKMSQRIGVSVEQLAGLQHAAKLSGVSNEQMAVGLRQLSKNMLDFSNGTGEAKIAFQSLGLDVTDATGKLKDSGVLMVEVADRFAGMQDGAEKTALAMRLFGESGATMIPMLNQGSDAIARMVAEGQRLNPVTTESAKRAEEFNDNLTRVSGSLKRVGISLVNDALPHLVDWADWLLKTVDRSGWLAEKTAELNEQIREQVEVLEELAIGEVARAMQRTYEEIIAKQRELVIAEAFARSAAGFKDDVEGLQVELEKLNELHGHYAQRLAELRAGAQPVVKVTKEMAQAAEEEAKRVSEAAKNREWLNMMFNQTADAYVDMMEAAGAAFPVVNTELDTFNQMIEQAAANAPAMAAAHEEATQLIIEDYRDMREDLSDIFQEVLGDWENAGEAMKRIGKGIALSIAGDLAASITLDMLGASPSGQGFSVAGALTNAGTAGKILTAGVDKLLPGLAGSLGIGSSGAAAKLAADQAAYVAMMQGGTAATAGTGGLLASAGGALKAGGSALMGGLSALATNPITWAVLGAGVLAKKFDNGGTPSWNAGFTTDPSAYRGKSGNFFAVDPFESGYAPVGFHRRSSEEDATQVIDVFRQVDSAIVNLAKSAGLAVNAGSIRGLNETLLAGTTGAVFGAGGEKGKPGLAIEQQLNMFAAQIIESLRGQVADSDLQQILSAGGVEQMLVAMDELLVATQRASMAAADLQRSLVDQYMGSDERLQLAQQQIDEVFSALNLAVPQTREEILALVRSLDPMTDAGQAAIYAISGLQDAFRLTQEAAERAADAQADLAAATEEVVQIIDVLENRVSISRDERTALRAAERERATDRFAGALDNVNRYLELIGQQQTDYAQREQDLLRRRFDLFQSLQSYTTSLLLSDKTTLSPSEQLALARSEFESLSGTALDTSRGMGERLAAAEQMQAAADAYLGSARSFFASSGEYKDIFDSVLQNLEAAKFLGTNKDPQVSELQSLNDTVATLPAGIAQALAPLMQDLISAAKADADSFTSGVQSLFSNEQLANLIQGLGPDAVSSAPSIAGAATSDETIRSLYETGLLPGSRASRPRGGWSLAQFASEMTSRGVTGARAASALGMTDREFQLMLAASGIPAFAAGGMHSGGVRLVGERGPELEVTGPSRIFSSGETRSMLSAGSSPEVLAEMRRLNGNMERLIAIEMSKGDFVGAKLDQQTRALQNIDGKLAQQQQRRVGSDAYAA